MVFQVSREAVPSQHCLFGSLTPVRVRWAARVMPLQKLQQIQAASEEERRRIEVTYKEKLASYDDKLRALRHREREFISMQKLKQRTEVRFRTRRRESEASAHAWPRNDRAVATLTLPCSRRDLSLWRLLVQDMCKRLNSDIQRIKQQKVALQKTMEASAKQFSQWRVEREKVRARSLAPRPRLRRRRHVLPPGGNCGPAALITSLILTSPCPRRAPAETPCRRHLATPHTGRERR